MERPPEPARARVLRRLLAAAAGLAFTLAAFLVLPMLQVVGSGPSDDLMLRDLAHAELPPPPPPPTPEVEDDDDEPPEPPPPPPMTEAQPLDLAQLELALQPGGGTGGILADVAVDVAAQVKAAGDGAGDRIFSLAELDQPPRALFQSPPRYPQELMRQRRRGTVQVVFLVSADGRVEEARVQSSTDPAFDREALAAVRQWRFEPGRRGGEAVPFTMRIPITFDAG